MAYSDKVMDHYENPRNVGNLDKQDPNVGTGQLVGLPWQFVGEGPVPLAPPPALGSSTADYTRTSHADITTT